MWIAQSAGVLNEPLHIRKYQAMLFTKLKFSPNTVIQRLGALIL